VDVAQRHVNGRRGCVGRALDVEGTLVAGRRRNDRALAGGPARIGAGEAIARNGAGGLAPECGGGVYVRSSSTASIRSVSVPDAFDEYAADSPGTRWNVSTRTGR